jgi:hypothetical protein
VILGFLIDCCNLIIKVFVLLRLAFVFLWIVFNQLVSRFYICLKLIDIIFYSLAIFLNVGELLVQLHYDLCLSSETFIQFLCFYFDQIIIKFGYTIVVVNEPVIHGI